MTATALAGTTAKAARLQIGDRVTWLAGWDYGEPVQVVDVQQFPADPEYVQITQEVEVVHSYFRTTRRLRKDRLVACVTAKAITWRDLRQAHPGQRGVPALHRPG